jgi:hypothetical protein
MGRTMRFPNCHFAQIKTGFGHITRLAAAGHHPTLAGSQSLTNAARHKGWISMLTLRLHALIGLRANSRADAAGGRGCPARSTLSVLTLAAVSQGASADPYPHF